MSITVERVTRVGVVVTFLRMDERPAPPSPGLPEGATVSLLRPCSVAQYRALYNTVGEDYVWWLRRTMPDGQLDTLLRDPRVEIHVLRHAGHTAGFYELDATNWPAMNLSYFGLMPGVVGQGLGIPFLRHAVDACWSRNPAAVTVNTCTADHPRALPNYIRCGFKPVREVRETWNVPVRLGLNIPEALKI